MSQIMYENEDSIIRFEYQDAVNHLRKIRDDNSMEGSAEIITYLEMKSGQGTTDLAISRAVDVPDRLLFFISDVLGSRNAHVYCKSCGRRVHPEEIIIQRDSPFKSNAGFGGDSYKCKKEHLFFYIKTWIK